MSGLSDEDRDAIRDAFDAWGHDYALLYPVVEAIVTRAVNEALTEAADAVDNWSAVWRDDRLTSNAIRGASSIVRARTT